jgi:Fanconi anemia group M protein
MIVIDDREPAELVELVSKESDQTRVERLDAGDVIVRDWLFERKRYSDVIGRLHDNESGLFTQLLATEEAAEKSDLEVALLLEGDLEQQLTEHNANRHTQYVGKKRIMRVLAGVYKMGFNVMYTVDRERTADFLVGLETESTADGPSAIRNTAGGIPSEQYPHYYTQGFSKVGPKTAESILEHFGSFRAVVNAEIDELKEVDGVGTKTAEHIHETVRIEIRDTAE